MSHLSAQKRVLCGRPELRRLPNKLPACSGLFRQVQWSRCPQISDSVLAGFISRSMFAKENAPRIALPRGWKNNIKSAMLHVISLAQFGMAYTHGWAANSINSRIRLKAKCEWLQQQVAQLTEGIRIKDARMARLGSRNRPHYPATECMAILLLRASHGWSLRQTAKQFLVTPATIASWVKRVDEQGPSALVQLREPVNKFPDFVWSWTTLHVAPWGS